MESADPTSKGRLCTVAVSISASLLIFSAGFLVSYSTIDPEWASANNAGPAVRLSGDTYWPILGSILAYNVPTILILYCGVLTIGLGSVVTAGLVGAYVGATFAIGVHATNLGSLLSAVGTYIAFEFGACVLAAAAGIYPAAAAIWQHFNRKNSSRFLVTYLLSLPLSLWLLGVAICLVMVAAAIESAVIIDTMEGI